MSDTQTIQPDSSVIETMTYDRFADTLEVEFVSGSVYSYLLNEIEWEEIVEAHESGDSVGRVFNRLVRPNAAIRLA